MKKSKLLIISSIALVFIFILAACGTGNEAEEPLPTANPAVSQEPAGEPSEEPMESEEPSEEPMESEEPSEEPMEEKTFTLAELAQFDGQDGNPAYVAVDGIVYDLTNSAAWRNGKHNGFTAGKDLTEEIKTISPHGVKNLEGIPIVGKLAED